MITYHCSMIESALPQSTGRVIEQSTEPAVHPTPEEAAAIAIALDRYFDETAHDYESYIITIKRRERK